MCLNEINDLTNKWTIINKGIRTLVMYYLYILAIIQKNISTTNLFDKSNKIPTIYTLKG